MITYIAGWNTPGCLPEMEPAEFDTVAEAWEYLADEIARDAAEVQGEPYSQAEFDLLTFAFDGVDRTRPGSFELAGLAYWVSEAEPADPVAEAHARHLREVSAVPVCRGCADPVNHPHAFDCEAAR